MNELAVAIYDLGAFASVMLLMFVIRQAVNDLHLNRTDPPWVTRARKLTFFSDAAYILLTVLFQEYWLLRPSVASVGLVTAGHLAHGMAILAVSVMSMWLRAPRSGHGAQTTNFLAKTSRLFTKIVR